MHKFWKWAKRITIGFLVFFLLFAGTGAIYQYVSTKIDERKYPPPGKLIDIGGYKLHINCTGEGEPTVVLDSGLGCDSLEWALVQTEIAKFTRVCSYDRAGYGWSEESPYARTSEQIVEELHLLLKNSHISGPYILVGHSFGGLNVQLYAKKYPDEVRGMILVDSGSDKIMEILPDEPEKSWIQKWISSPKIQLLATRLGIHRLILHSFENKNEFSGFNQDMILANQSSTKQMKAMLAESDNFIENVQQLKNVHPLFGDLPLTVIAAGKPPTPEGSTAEWVQYSQDFFKAWRFLQKDLATRSSKGKFVIAEKSDHMIPWNQPEIIVEAVKEVYEESKVSDQ